MIKLLIVDDEPLVQIGIKSMLDWNSLGIELCATANNGVQALEFIKTLSPDIVITDIKMPLMNGLELIKTCRDNFGKIPLFLILTSYEEFPLVKEALTYQVIDYLIKLELDAASLTAAIIRTKDRLAELRGIEGDQAIAHPLLQIDYDKFFMRLLHNLFDHPEQFRLQVKDLQLNFDADCFLATHCEIHESIPRQQTQAQLRNLYNSTIEMVKDILAKHLSCYIFSLDMKHFTILFYAGNDALIDDAAISTALNTASSMIHNYFNVWLSIGIGSFVNHPLMIHESYQDARRAFRLTTADQPVINYLQTNPSTQKNSFNIAIFKKDITTAFEEFNTDVLFKILTEIMDLFEAFPSRFIQAVDGACNILYLSISLLPDGEQTVTQIFADYPGDYRSLYQLSNVEQIIHWMATLRDGLCQTLQLKRVTYKEHVVTNVQKYIENHIDERLTLNEVSAIFGLSPNYLSMLFKKSSELGFSEYITTMKIAKAKALLLTSDLKIYQIADQLGFDNAFYFSKVFKKVEGISPREYLKTKIKNQ